MPFPVAEEGKEPENGDAPENNPQYTTVYVGNLAPLVRYSHSLFCPSENDNSVTF